MNEPVLLLLWSGYSSSEKHPPWDTTPLPAERGGEGVETGEDPAAVTSPLLGDGCSQVDNERRRRRVRSDLGPAGNGLPVCFSWRVLVQGLPRVDERLILDGGHDTADGWLPLPSPWPALLLLSPDER